MIEQSIRCWRKTLSGKFDEVRRKPKARVNVSSRELADLLMTIFEGSFVQLRVLKEPRLVVEQLEQHKSYIELLFGADPSR